jgi:alpha-glucosidase
MLELYRRALRIRREHPGLGDETMSWLPSPAGALLFERGAGLRCAVNLSLHPLQLPKSRTTLLRSDAGDPDELTPHAAIWYVI